MLGWKVVIELPRYIFSQLIWLKITNILVKLNSYAIIAGSDPETQISQLTQNGDYFAVIILKSPDKKLGLIRHVITDFSSHFGSRKLAFTVEMTPVYLRKLKEIVQYSKW